MAYNLTALPLITAFLISLLIMCIGCWDFMTKYRQLSHSEKKNIPVKIKHLTFITVFMFMFCVVILSQHVFEEVFTSVSSAIYDPNSISWQEYLVSTIYTIGKDFTWILLYLRLVYCLQYTILEITSQKKLIVFGSISFHTLLVSSANLLQLIWHNQSTDRSNSLFLVINR